MKNTPKKIYLQIGDTFDGDLDGDDFGQLVEVTWCKDRIWKTDLEYVSVDAVRALIERQRKNADRIRTEYPGTSHPATIDMVIDELENLLK